MESDKKKTCEWRHLVEVVAGTSPVTAGREASRPLRGFNTINWKRLFSTQGFDPADDICVVPVGWLARLGVQKSTLPNNVIASDRSPSMFLMRKRKARDLGLSGGG